MLDYKERILIASFLLYSLVLVSIFDGNLIHVYNKLDRNPPFKNLEEFFTYNIPVLPSSSRIEIVFKDLHCGLYNRTFCNLDEKLISLEKLTNITGEDLIVQNYDKYLSERFAIFSFIGEARQKFVEDSKRGVQNITDFLIVSDIFEEMRKKMGIIVSKKLRFSSHINRYITRLREGRITSTWYQSWNTQFEDRMKMSTNSKGLHDFALEEFWLPFIGLGIGILSGFIVFLLEIFYDKLRQLCTISKKMYNLIECNKKKQNKKK